MNGKGSMVGIDLDVLISVVESSDGAYVFGGYTNSISVMLLLIMDFMIFGYSKQIAIILI